MTEKELIELTDAIIGRVSLIMAALFGMDLARDMARLRLGDAAGDCLMIGWIVACWLAYRIMRVYADRALARLEREHQDAP